MSVPRFAKSTPFLYEVGVLCVEYAISRLEADILMYVNR